MLIEIRLMMPPGLEINSEKVETHRYSIICRKSRNFNISTTPKSKE